MQTTEQKVFEFLGRQAFEIFTLREALREQQEEVKEEPKKG